MKTLKQFLTEGISNIVYRYESTHIAVMTMKNNAFHLTAPVSSDRMLKGKIRNMFYLSMTRSKHGRYHSGNLAGVIFEIDGRKLGNNYRGRAVDYWGPNYRKADPTFNEMEDRVFHTKPIIKNAAKFIRAIHVLLPIKQGKPARKGVLGNEIAAVPKGSVEADLTLHEKKAIASIWFNAKKLKVPIHFYDSNPAWLTQRKPMDLKVAQLALNPEDRKEFPPIGPQFGKADRKSSLHFWVELIKKPASKKLSGEHGTYGASDALRLLDTLRREYEMLSVFDADFQNSKHTKDAAFIVTFMRKKKFADFKELLTFLQKKWKVR